MKKTALILVAAAALGACSHEPARISDVLANALHTNPVLTVREGYISVAPEPIVFSKKLAKDPIVWHAPTGYTFPVRDGKERKDGIEILGLLVDSQGRPLPPGPETLKETGATPRREDAQAFKCGPRNAERTAFACEVNKDALKKGVYRYVIRLLDKDGKLIEWDPSVFAMD